MPSSIHDVKHVLHVYFCIVLFCVTEVLPAKNNRRKDNCWTTLNAKEHFSTMEALEQKYEKARMQYNKQQLLDGFDEEMLGILLENQGQTNREAQKARDNHGKIPSGINLGGHSMMRMPDSVMFFHRMKLRNDTRFRVSFLSSNFSSMTMLSHLALNDLHLVGNYERAQTKDNPALLQYSPTYGQIEVLLRDVVYKIDGRYRLQKDRLYMEMILSEMYIPYDGILMLYTNSSNKGEQKFLQTKNIADFLDRLKTDLDLWMKDFFNEFLLDHSLTNVKTKQTFLQYDKERIMTLNRYVDSALDFLKNRLKSLKADVVKLPSFVIYAFHGMVLHLKDGSLSGLDTMYRRSMATNSVDKDLRKVDALIAFSSLKARYSFEVNMTTGAPPIHGSLILSGDELSAIMSLSMVKEPPFVDLHFDFLRQLKPESLIIEGSVDRMMTSFKHILELHIVAIMTNTMIDQVKQLSSLTKCEPTLISHHDERFNGIDKEDPADQNDKHDEDNDANTMEQYRHKLKTHNSQYTSPRQLRRPHHRNKSHSTITMEPTTEATTTPSSNERSPIKDADDKDTFTFKKQDLISPDDTDVPIY